MPVDADADPVLTEFTCPRCGVTASEHFYGPCATCRADLRQLMGREARVREREAFEPSMHVTPNAVAQKDD